MLKSPRVPFEILCDSIFLGTAPGRWLDLWGCALEFQRLLPPATQPKS